MNWSLPIAVVLLVAWVVLGFAMPVGIGAVHLLLAIGATFFVRWWALRH
jgi:hypothetical protein